MKLYLADNEAHDGNGNKEQLVKNKLPDDELHDGTKQPVSNNVVSITKQCNHVNTRSYSLCRSISVNKENDDMNNTVNVTNPPSNISSNEANAATAGLQRMDVGDDKEIDVQKENEGKNYTVKVRLDSDVEIIGEAFVSSDTIAAVDVQHNDNDETVKPNGKKTKKQTRKLRKVNESDEKLLLNVHRGVMLVAMPHEKTTQSNPYLLQ